MAQQRLSVGDMVRVRPEGYLGRSAVAKQSGLPAGTHCTVVATYSDEFAVQVVTAKGHRVLMENDLEYARA